MGFPICCWHIPVYNRGYRIALRQSGYFLYPLLSQLATMTTKQWEFFWSEVRLIRQRHLLFFPLEEMARISVTNLEGINKLIIAEESALPEVVKEEIRFAFNLSVG